MSKKLKNKVKVRPSDIRKPEEKAPAYEVNDLSGWHKVLAWLKAMLVMSYMFNIIAFVSDGVGRADSADILFNVVFLALISASLIFHSRRLGVYLFFAFGILELLYNVMIMVLASRNGVYDTAVGNRTFEYLFFSFILLVPTAVYYKKRMSVFKS